MISIEELSNIIKNMSNPSYQHLFLRNYCLEKGKNIELTRVFLEALIFSGMLKEYFRIALDKYLREGDLILLYDKNNTLIKVVKNERIDISAEGCS